LRGGFDAFFGIESFQQNQLWLTQGGVETKNSITKYGTTDEYKEFVKKFLMNAVPFHIEDHMLFVHGGIDPISKVEDNSPYELMWNRTLIKEARYASMESNPLVTEYDEVFIGHTPTLHFNTYLPLHYSNVWAIDTGVCYNGVLTIMDVKTKEYWQSDIPEK
jgi:serine/threonine protein phosphatase 1